jgi:hypothetical protein
MLTNPVLREETFPSILQAKERAVERSKRTHKFIYLVQDVNRFVIHSHGVLRTNQKLIATYKQGQQCL